MTHQHDHHPTIIIGAGPIGLELAVCLQNLNHDYLHIDAGQIGQTITWYPKQVRFFSSPERIAIAGLPLTTPNQEKASREQYLAYLRSVVQHYNLAINTFENVISINKNSFNTFTIKTSKLNGESCQYTCDNLVLAIGDMHRPHKLNIPGEDLPHVSHYFDEPHQYFNQKLLIIGGKNSAVEAAIRCYHAGAKVTIAYRRDNFDKTHVKYWLYPEIRSLIKAGKINFLPNVIPTAIAPHQTTLSSVSWSQTNNNQPDNMIINPNAEPQIIDTDFVLLLTGYEQDDALFNQLGVQLEGPNRRPHFDPRTMQTNIENVYVAGTAIGGTQKRFLVFIENCHIHAARIAESITGRKPDPKLLNDAAATYALPES
ncbi:NAD(P)-binding domain-containing protein [Poriferisphaera sp. WC338]|uniref:NAD(P)-binding domain-containing protein n=1 Tax=Poriferisphaera sp. WC338 TaxID=3425129 RepID=UPI003D817094